MLDNDVVMDENEDDSAFFAAIDKVCANHVPSKFLGPKDGQEFPGMLPQPFRSPGPNFGLKKQQNLRSFWHGGHGDREALREINNEEENLVDMQIRKKQYPSHLGDRQGKYFGNEGQGNGSGETVQKKKKTTDWKMLSKSNFPRKMLITTEGADASKWQSPFDNDNSHDFDKIAGARWIYPVSVDRPRREYQFHIAERALFTNTLVCLPTGLGKTLIAAVVMLNFFRWFPKGKIVFLAPTKPLVTQQMSACHSIAMIPEEAMVCMTGNTPVEQRAELWRLKRVFFMTGETLQRDLQEHRICPKGSIVCLVIDEAHKASGRYAYCLAVEELVKSGVRFRLLALTATPGGTHERVQEVVDNLLISRLELRDETDVDVQQYTFDRVEQVRKVAVQSDAQAIVELLHQEQKDYTQYLIQNLDIQLPALGHSFILQQKKGEFERRRKEEGGFRDSDQSLLRAFANAHFLAYLAEILTVYGAGSVLKKITENKDSRIKLDSLRMREAHRSLLRIKEKGVTSPKLTVLETVILNHFICKGIMTGILNILETWGPKKTKAIVFTNLRESVMEIVDVLNARHADGVNAKEFIGQQTGRFKGISQKKQIAIIQDFRKGQFNVLVATSIGEEGLDIDQVDLVIAFDCMSGGRMTQRMGRTGRQRDGKVIVLASEGAEFNKYRREKSKGQKLKDIIRIQGAELLQFHDSPRMVPHACINPEPFEQEMKASHWQRYDLKRNLTEEEPTEEHKRKRQRKSNVKHSKLTSKNFETPSSVAVGEDETIADDCENFAIMDDMDAENHGEGEDWEDWGCETSNGLVVGGHAELWEPREGKDKSVFVFDEFGVVIGQKFGKTGGGEGEGKGVGEGEGEELETRGREWTNELDPQKVELRVKKSEGKNKEDDKGGKSGRDDTEKLTEREGDGEEEKSSEKLERFSPENSKNAKKVSRKRTAAFEKAEGQKKQLRIEKKERGEKGESQPKKRESRPKKRESLTKKGERREGEDLEQMGSFVASDRTKVFSKGSVLEEKPAKQKREREVSEVNRGKRVNVEVEHHFPISPVMGPERGPCLLKPCGGSIDDHETNFQTMETFGLDLNNKSTEEPAIDPNCGEIRKEVEVDACGFVSGIPTRDSSEDPSDSPEIHGIWDSCNGNKNQEDEDEIVPASPSTETSSDDVPLQQKYISFCKSLNDKRSPFVSKNSNDSSPFVTEAFRDDSPIAPKDNVLAPPSTQTSSDDVPLQQKYLSLCKSLRNNSPLVSKTFRDTFKDDSPIVTKAIRGDSLIGPKVHVPAPPTQTSSDDVPLQQKSLSLCKSSRSNSPLVSKTFRETFKDDSPVVTKAIKGDSLVAPKDNVLAPPSTQTSSDDVPLQQKYLSLCKSLRSNFPRVSETFSGNSPVVSKKFKDNSPIVTKAFRNSSSLDPKTFRDTMPIVMKTLKDNSPVIPKTFGGSSPTVQKTFKDDPPTVVETLRGSSLAVPQTSRNIDSIVAETFRNDFQTVSNIFGDNPPFLPKALQGNSPIVLKVSKSSLPTVPKIFSIVQKPLRSTSPIVSEDFKNDSRTVPKKFGVNSPNCPKTSGDNISPAAQKTLQSLSPIVPKSLNEQFNTVAGTSKVLEKDVLKVDNLIEVLPGVFENEGKRKDKKDVDTKKHEFELPQSSSTSSSSLSSSPPVWRGVKRGKTTSENKKNKTNMKGKDVDESEDWQIREGEDELEEYKQECNSVSKKPKRRLKKVGEKGGEKKRLHKVGDKRCKEQRKGDGTKTAPDLKSGQINTKKRGGKGEKPAKINSPKKRCMVRQFFDEEALADSDGLEDEYMGSGWRREDQTDSESFIATGFESPLNSLQGGGRGGGGGESETPGSADQMAIYREIPTQEDVLKRYMRDIYGHKRSLLSQLPVETSHSPGKVKSSLLPRFLSSPLKFGNRNKGKMRFLPSFVDAQGELMLCSQALETKHGEEGLLEESFEVEGEESETEERKSESYRFSEERGWSLGGRRGRASEVGGEGDALGGGFWTQDGSERILEKEDCTVNTVKSRDGAGEGGEGGGGKGGRGEAGVRGERVEGGEEGGGEGGGRGRVEGGGGERGESIVLTTGIDLSDDIYSGLDLDALEAEAQREIESRSLQEIYPVRKFQETEPLKKFKKEIQPVRISEEVEPSSVGFCPSILRNNVFDKNIIPNSFQNTSQNTFQNGFHITFQNTQNRFQNAPQNSFQNTSQNPLQNGFQNSFQNSAHCSKFWGTNGHTQEVTVSTPIWNNGENTLEGGFSGPMGINSNENKRKHSGSTSVQNSFDNRIRENVGTAEDEGGWVEGGMVGGGRVGEEGEGAGEVRVREVGIGGAVRENVRVGKGYTGISDDIEPEEDWDWAPNFRLSVC